jgi:hypothetical protein
MIEVIRLGSPNKNRYGRFFLASEADDEEVDLSGVKFNTKLIEIKPSKRGKDFTMDAEEPISEEEPIDTTSEVDYSDDGMDYTSDDPTPQEDTSATDPSVEDPSITDGPPDDPTGALMNDQTDFNQYGDQTDDGGEVEVNTDADMSGEDEPMMDDQDFTGDAENPEEGDPNAAPETPQAKGPGLEFDSTRKYLLFKSFGTLSNAIENYISKLSDCMSDDLERNKIVMKAIDKLKEINDLCKDYMLMKFEISSYIQSLLFYQNLIVMVQTVFGFFGKSSKKKKNEKSTAKH